jgi:hypothetical protein
VALPIEHGGIQVGIGGTPRATPLWVKVVLLDAEVGWEAAVFDQYRAIVQTICQRMALGSGSAQARTVCKSDEAWACAFGDGDATTPSQLDWFESCEEDTPLACE